MAIVPIKLPPGMFRNGTPYDAKNRYFDGNLIRWHDGSMRPIGGWERLRHPSTNLPLDPIIADPAVEVIRDAITWRGNNGSKEVVFGSNKGLYHLNAAGDIENITPDNFPTDLPTNPASLSGYGIGPYGAETYGTRRSSGLSSALPVFRWSFDLWGEELVAAPAIYRESSHPEIGKLYIYKPGTPKAVQVINAPEDSTGLCVSQQRILMSINDDQEPRTVKWSSRENNTVWAPAIDNEAGSYPLQGSGRLLYIGRILNQVLILSETDGYVARYIGAPFIYGFDLIGDNCGPLHAATVVTTDRFAIWLGRRSIWMYDGTLRQVKCDIMDYLQHDINFDTVSTMFSIDIPEFNEVWWFYRSTGATTEEVDSYFAFDYVDNHWTAGRLDRNAGISSDTFDDTLMVDAAGHVYIHELQSVLVEGAYAESGPIELGQGESNIAVRRVIPDTQENGNITLSLIGARMPTAPETVYGPYPFANPIMTKAMGRQIRMRIDGLSNDWEVGGTMRFDVSSLGTGRR